MYIAWVVYTVFIYRRSLIIAKYWLVRWNLKKMKYKTKKNLLEKCLWATHQREITLNYARQLLKLCHKRIAILIEDLFRNRLKTTNFIDGFFLLSISCYLYRSLSLFFFFPHRSASGFDTLSQSAKTHRIAHEGITSSDLFE